MTTSNDNENETLILRSRFAKAAFFGSAGAVIAMYENKQIDADKAMSYIGSFYRAAIDDVLPALTELAKEMGLIDDLPLV